LNKATVLDNVLEERVQEFARTNVPTEYTIANDVLRSGSIYSTNIKLKNS